MFSKRFLAFIGYFLFIITTPFIAYSDMTYYIKEIIRHVSHATSA